MDAKELVYVRPEDVSADSLHLRGEEFHHLVHVLRKKVGSAFLAADGRGNHYDAEIDRLQKTELRARIIKKKRLAGEPVFKLTLALALLKKARFEWAIEKATELGVAHFIPMQTARTIPPASSLNPKRCARIALAAMKQSWRSLLPTISETQNFKAVCRQASEYDVKLLAHEKASDANLDQIFAGDDALYKKNGLLCIGPEGGFSDEEIELAQQAGFTIFGMGPRRLRAETAAIVGAALILDRLR